MLYKSACYSFREAVIRLKTPGSEVKAWITHGRAGSRRFAFSLVLLAPKCSGAKAEAGPEASCSHSGFGKPQSYTVTARTPAQHLPTRETLSLLPSEKNNRPFWTAGKYYLCLPRLFPRQTSLKRVQDKRYHKSCRNKVETCPLTTHCRQSSLFTILYLGMHLLTKIYL